MAKQLQITVWYDSTWKRIKLVGLVPGAISLRVEEALDLRDKLNRELILIVPEEMRPLSEPTQDLFRT